MQLPRSRSRTLGNRGGVVHEHAHAEPGAVSRGQLASQRGPQRDPVGSIVREHRLRRGGQGRHALDRLRPHVRTAPAIGTLGSICALDAVPPAEYRRRRCRRTDLRRQSPGTAGLSLPRARERRTARLAFIGLVIGFVTSACTAGSTPAASTSATAEPTAVALRDGGADAGSGADRRGIPRGARRRAANRDRRPVHGAAAMRRE